VVVGLFEKKEVFSTPLLMFICCFFVVQMSHQQTNLRSLQIEVLVSLLAHIPSA